MSDFHEDCLNRICEKIKALQLSGLDATEIVVRRQAFKRGGDGTLIPHRGITIHPEPERELEGTNRSEDIGYGCGVTMYAAADHASTANVDKVPAWRRQIRREFINQRLDNVTVQSGHVCISTVEHGDFAKDFDHSKYEIGTLLIRVWARETRS